MSLSGTEFGLEPTMRACIVLGKNTITGSAGDVEIEINTERD